MDKKQTGSSETRAYESALTFRLKVTKRTVFGNYESEGDPWKVRLVLKTKCFESQPKVRTTAQRARCQLCK